MRKFFEKLGAFLDRQGDKINARISKRFKVVEKRNIYFVVSSVLVICGVVGMIIFGMLGEITGGALNFGSDFAGGYALQIELKSRIDDDADFDRYSREIKETIENAADTNGNAFGLRVTRIQKQGSGEDGSVYVSYKGASLDGEAIEVSMSETINPRLQEILEQKYFSGPNTMTGRVIMSGSVGSSVSTELIYGAIGAIVLASVLMFLYIMFRFELSSGIAAIIAVVHDVMIIVTFMAFTRITVNSSFIAAIVTVMGYAINNSIIVFDRVREIKKGKDASRLSGKAIANQAISESLTRAVNTTITTLITLSMVTIIGVPSIREFTAPIIVGLLSGVYSSLCLAPSIWAYFRDRSKIKNKKAYAKRMASKNAK